MSTRFSAVLFSLLASTAFPAYAHPLVEEGIRAYEDADFDAALDAFRRAEQSSDLGRADLIDLLHNRALVFFALADTASMEGDLRRLAAVDREHILGSSVPPPVRESFERIREEGEEAVELPPPIGVGSSQGEEGPTTSNVLSSRPVNQGVDGGGEDDDGISVVWWIGGGVLVAAAVVVAIVLLSGGEESSDTQLSAPMIVPP